ncbi:Molybdenum cofactor sulfurase [Fulvia fulva]|uniref:Molybdenum cofactor sulfurase n=1 Tax=Passalora fulva TaxID=5499 RepID=A0A9Q8PGH6_PASFU|nr:Molybdenum cofactor sulfurase [Fulvia fulva]KAK4613546.1 Molybdenum cofactor sulfurase [Fulvia fulva]KAK4614491.1 Molybdenum cofactor sulfurase [Fulvia fulva]UJO21977.1 Molybdenum cofactor sulfurase [Fulvia fulva]WPV20317.1 Molybdenum cofactor sulfurase [Fulvia fulva]WPV35537.1 Molybdenum cofactor sulfurase [Fulvia fulva]
MKVERILCYPIKALREVDLDSVQVTKHGFPHDRRFILLHVDHKDGKPNYKNIHIGHYPQSALFFPSLDTSADLIRVTYKPPKSTNAAESTLDIALKPFVDDRDIVDVEMHKSPTKAYLMDPAHHAWFSKHYGIDVVLAYLGPHYRPVLMSSSLNGPAPPAPGKEPAGWLTSLSKTVLGGPKPEQEVTFSDCAPYLIASSASMEDLHHRLPEGERMNIEKFRPNIIVSGADGAWDEDFWGEITITKPGDGDDDNATRIACIHNCGRCKSINIDFETGAPGEGASGQMLKHMQKDRRVDPGMKYSPIFGRYSFLGKGCEGNVIGVGDEVVVSRRIGERTKFDWAGLCTLPSRQ